MRSGARESFPTFPIVAYGFGVLGSGLETPGVLEKMELQWESAGESDLESAMLVQKRRRKFPS